MPGNPGRKLGFPPAQYVTNGGVVVFLVFFHIQCFQVVLSFFWLESVVVIVILWWHLINAAGLPGLIVLPTCTGYRINRPKSNQVTTDDQTLQQLALDISLLCVFFKLG